MKAHAPWIAGGILGLLLLVSFGLDFQNTARGGSIDLRNRITGIRLLAHGIDAYHYKWDHTQPDIYCDPYNNPQLAVSKTTATPALLLLHGPLAELPYRSAQFGWFYIQWLLLLATAGLWLSQCTTTAQRLWLAAFIVGFTYTAAWRLHAERGQSYVLLLFVFGSWLAATLRPASGNHFLTGMLAGWLIALRLPFLLLIPFLALHRRGQLPGAALGLILGVGLPLLLNAHAWSDYYKGMQDYSEIYRNAYEPEPGPQRFPATLEGTPTDLVAAYTEIPYADFSAHAFLRWFGFAPFPALPLLLAIVVPLGMWLWLTRGWPLPEVLTGLVAWCFLVDLFLPAYRDNYNDVMIINLIALGLVGCRRLPCGMWPCLLALPLGWIVYVFAPRNNWITNSTTLLLTIGVVLFLLPFAARRGEHESRKR